MKQKLLLQVLSSAVLATGASAAIIDQTSYQNNSTDSTPTYTVSSSDLLQTDLASVSTVGTGGSEGTSGPAVLTDGIEPNPLTRAGRTGDNGPSGGAFPFSQFLVAGNNGYTELTFNLTAAANISQINVYGGWQDSGRDEQAYTISYSTNGGASYTTLDSVDFNPATGASGDPTSPGDYPTATEVSFLDDGGAAIASGVTNLRFDFGNVENGYTGYTEIDAVAAVPEPGALGLLGLAAAGFGAYRRRRA